MQKYGFRPTVIPIALSLALFAQALTLAQTPTPVPPPPQPDAAASAAVKSDPVKAVAARKQRCRLHPGTCTRGDAAGKAAAPKPAQRE
ncbi:MAG TPA: hypothetical protein VGL34_12895 [Steroidobacteraceae bacterium]|jgi:hypothetical protein